MVGGGRLFYGGQVEFGDLNNGSGICQDVSTFPNDNEGGVGIFLEDRGIICGGSNGLTTYDTIYNECYSWNSEV